MAAMVAGSVTCWVADNGSLPALVVTGRDRDDEIG